MSALEHRVDYISEDEAYAIRTNAFGARDWQYNHSDLTISLKGRHNQIVRIPRDVVVRYMDDWQASGLWSLPGRRNSDDPTVGMTLDADPKT